MADSPLQKSPLGLLGLFGLKTLGRNPGRFVDSVQPTFDGLELYALDSFGGQPTTGWPTANLALGGQSTAVGGMIIRVPQSEVWRVIAAAMFFSTAAGDVATVFSGSMQLSLSGASGQSQGAFAAPAVGGLSRWASFALPGVGLWLRSGCQMLFEGYSSVPAVATTACQAFCWYQKFAV